MILSKDADGMANSVGSDQNAPKEQFDLGLHCFAENLSQFLEFIR